MRFQSIIIAVAVASAPAMATPSCDEIVDNFNDLSNKCEEITNTCSSSSLLNILVQAPIILGGFTSIAAMATIDIAALVSIDIDASASVSVSTREAHEENPTILGSVTELIDDAAANIAKRSLNPSAKFGKRTDLILPGLTFAEEEQYLICDAFHHFVDVHSSLLNSITGKHGLLASIPLLSPLGGTLRTVDHVVDSLLSNIIEFVPVCASACRDDQAALSLSVSACLDIYV